MIVSDHGFQSGELPGRANRLSPRFGIVHKASSFCTGPGIRADEMIEGASLLDIAPTCFNVARSASW